MRYRVNVDRGVVIAGKRYPLYRIVETDGFDEMALEQVKQAHASGFLVSEDDAKAAMNQTTDQINTGESSAVKVEAPRVVRKRK